MVWDDPSAADLQPSAAATDGESHAARAYRCKSLFHSCLHAPDKSAINPGNTIQIRNSPPRRAMAPATSEGQKRAAVGKPAVARSFSPYPLSEHFVIVLHRAVPEPGQSMGPLNSFPRGCAGATVACCTHSPFNRSLPIARANDDWYDGFIPAIPITKDPAASHAGIAYYITKYDFDLARTFG